MKNSIYMGIVALAMSLASCQKDDSPTIDPNAVRVSASIGDNVDSRSNPNGDNPEDRMKFNNNDAISIQADDQDAIVHTLSGSTWAPTGNYLLWKSNEMTFSAFHPVSVGTSMDAFALPSDQRDGTKIATADYMTFRGLKTKDAGVVNLAFIRQTARVIVRIDAFGSSVTNSTVSDLMINSGIGEIGGATIAPVIPFVVGDGGEGTTYTALVIPTASKVGESFITLKVAGSDLIVLDIPALEAGYSYTYNLKVGKEKTEVNSITVTEWGTGEIINEDAEEEEEVPPIDLSKYPTIDCIGPSDVDPNIPAYSHTVYVYDRNAGVNVPTSEDVSIALNWINDGTNTTPDANYAFKGDYYTWAELFTGSIDIGSDLKDGIVNEETNPCYKMGNGWRVPTVYELLSLFNNEDTYTTITGTEIKITGNNGATCYFPLSGISHFSDNVSGSYWTSNERVDGSNMVQHYFNLDPLDDPGYQFKIEGNNTGSSMSVRCVKTAPSSAPDL